MQKEIVCTNCHAQLGEIQRSITCPQCSTNAVEFQVFFTADDKPAIHQANQGVWRYSDFLPDFTQKISLGEGLTPIRKAHQLFAEDIQLSFKLEGKNPTGSFLDRVSPVLVSDAIAKGMVSTICASDGNLGASISAYCANAGLDSICVVPKSTSPEKKVQMIAHGAKIIDYGDTIDDSLDLARKMTDEQKYQATPEFNIFALEGIKTISLELIEQILIGKENNLPWPEFLVVPIGSGRLLYSIWKGLKEGRKANLIAKHSLPKIIGVQLKGYDSITDAFIAGEEIIKTSKSPKYFSSLADAIMVKKSIYALKALESIKESNGIALSVSEKELVNASQRLGKEEGIFVELSSAAVVAGLEKLINRKYFSSKTKVLAIITASGLKTSQAFQKSAVGTKKIDSFRTMGTKIEILRLIASEKADFGYAIWKAMGESISLQAIYQHLKELAQSQHIEEIESSSRQKKYNLTEKGKKLLQKMTELEELLP